MRLVRCFCFIEAINKCCVVWPVSWPVFGFWTCVCDQMPIEFRWNHSHYSSFHFSCYSIPWLLSIIFFFGVCEWMQFDWRIRETLGVAAYWCVLAKSNVASIILNGWTILTLWINICVRVCGKRSLKQQQQQQ